MKRFIPLIIFILLLSSFIFAEDEPINKTFIVNGEKVTRWVQQESLEEYDKNGNTVHYKSIIDGFLEYHKEYNEKNLLVKFQLQTLFSSSVEYFNYDSQGNKIKSFKETSIGLPEEITNQKPKVQKSTVLSEYSSSNILIHEKSNDPYDEFEYWAELDEQNNITHRKRVGSEAFEQWADYDKDGHQIHYKEIGESNYEYWLEYNDKGFATHRKQIGPQNYDCFGSYDSKGNLIYEKYTGDIKLERWIEYGKKRIITKEISTGQESFEFIEEKDLSGNLIHCKRTGSDEFECWKEYDSAGHLIYEKREGSSPYDNRFSYDTHGNIIYTKRFNYETSFYDEYFTEYEYWNNGNKKTAKVYKAL